MSTEGVATSVETTRSHRRRHLELRQKLKLLGAPDEPNWVAAGLQLKPLARKRERRSKVRARARLLLSQTGSRARVRLPYQSNGKKSMQKSLEQEKDVEDELLVSVQAEEQKSKSQIDTGARIVWVSDA